MSSLWRVTGLLLLVELTRIWVEEVSIIWLIWLALLSFPNRIRTTHKWGNYRTFCSARTVLCWVLSGRSHAYIDPQTSSLSVYLLARLHNIRNREYTERHVKSFETRTFVVEKKHPNCRCFPITICPRCYIGYFMGWLDRRNLDNKIFHCIFFRY